MSPAPTPRLFPALAAAALLLPLAASARTDRVTGRTPEPELLVQALDRSLSTAVLSGDGRWLITGSGDRRVQVWDARTGLLTRNLPTGGPVAEVDLSPDARVVAAGGLEGAVRLWDRETGAERAVLKTDPQGTLSVRFSPAGPHLATADHRGVKLWHAGTGRFLRALEGTGDFLSIGLYPGVAFSPDGKLLAALTMEGWALWDPAIGRKLRQLPKQLDRDTAVAFSRDGKLLATAHVTARYTLPTAEIAFWSTATGKRARAVTTGQDALISLAFAPDDRTLLAGTRFSRGLQVWDVPSGKRLRTVGSLPGAVTLSRDGRTLAAWSSGFGAPPEVRTWRVSDLRTMKTMPLAALPTPAEPVSVLQAAGAGSTLVAVGETGRAWRWDGERARLERAVSLPGGAYQRVVLSADGATAAAASVDCLTVWDTATGRVRRTFRFTGEDLGESVAALTPDGRRVALADRAYPGDRNLLYLRWWSVETGEQQGELRWPETVPLALAASREELILTVINVERERRELRGVDLRTGQLRRTQPLEGFPGSALGVSPDGATAAVPMHAIVGDHWDFPVDLWSRERDRPTARLLGFRQVPESVTFSTSGARVAAGGSEGTVRVWKAESETPLTTLRAHRREVAALAFVGENRLATAGGDGELALWEVPGGKRLATLLVFPSGEWLAYRPDHRYTGSPGIEKRLAWRVGRRVVSGSKSGVRFRVERLLPPPGG
ncbi:MAG: WD40 repeat domain-containing protein [Armatimonadota bacterium]